MPLPQTDKLYLAAPEYPLLQIIAWPGTHEHSYSYRSPIYQVISEQDPQDTA